MRFGVGAIALANRFFTVLCVYSVLSAFIGLSTTVYAADSTVQTNIDSGALHPSLALTSPSPATQLTTMPLDLKGTVSSLTQIQVYVNNTFSVTIPLDEGAALFSYNLVLPPGTHEVKLVGISPFVDNTPTAVVSVTYTPPTNTPENPAHSTTSTTVTEKGGAIINRDPTSSATTTYITPTYASSLPSWFYNGLLALDIARPNDTDGKELAKTVQRITLASSGLFLFAFARPALFIYRKVRYAWLGLSKGAMPALVQSRPLLFIRITGALLISGVFWFI